ncbi:E3 ubiquitin-protein ligase [Durusdinium trenchii]|uniref:E3 ubiquitin-protein ligase n=1 Tax=Durusdinium trenchii TaxID=1381693 RepID=A0ABP0IBI7_9DINO
MATLILDSDEEEDVVILSELPAPKPTKLTKVQKKRLKEKKRRERKRLKKQKQSEAEKAKELAVKAKAPPAKPKPPTKKARSTAAAGAPSETAAVVRELCYRVRTAGDYPAALCAECRRPLDAQGRDVAVVEVERPWLREPCLVHAQLCCLAAAGLLHPARPSELTQRRQLWAPAGLIQRPMEVRTSTETHGVLRSIGLAPRARPARPLRPAADGERVARGAGSGVDARSLAAR